MNIQCGAIAHLSGNGFGWVLFEDVDSNVTQNSEIPGGTFGYGSIPTPKIALGENILLNIIYCR